MLKVMLATLAVVFAGQAASACTMPAQANSFAAQIAQGVNSHRQAHGLQPLAYNARLSQAAMTHACDMARNGIVSHQGSDGSTAQARVRAAGYHDCTVAENLAWGYPTPNQIIGGWMGSPKHKSNMLHPRVTEMGIGITTGAKGPDWVLVLARHC